ncbi:MAG TPA: hypothetical protein VEQ37_07035 [Actinomycetota bacterium]|nr:hypothetical protein [Actinomycetota bacterium]
MSFLFPIAVGAGVSWSVAVLLPPGYWRRLSVPNHRGVLVSGGLGLPIALAVVPPGVMVLLVITARGTHVEGFLWAMLGAATLVFLAGLLDDLLPGGPRGLRGHVLLVSRGSISTGLIKAAAGVMGGALVAFLVPGRSVLDRTLGIVVIAGAANLWNGFDVAPARAVKLFLLAAVPLAVVHPTGTLLRAIGAVLPAGWVDLRERAMLGDAGANFLGFLAGAHLYLYADLSLWALCVAAVASIGLNLAAETVTLSRIIEATAPLRWFDRLGRLPVPQTEPEGGVGPRDSSAT